MGGGGPSSGHSSPIWNAYPTTDTGEVGSTIEALSRGAERALVECEYETPLCVADALDQYAAALQQIAPQLPPRLRSLPNIVARAATRVRASRSPAEAVRAVKIAIAEVHKSIVLLKADDPTTLKAETRVGAFVAETLQVADNKLEEAVGL
jgi:hypothetical protein